MTSAYYILPMKIWTPREIEGFRKNNSLTRKSLGELLGTTVSTIYKWERGLRTPGKPAKILLSKVEKELKGGKKV